MKLLHKNLLYTSIITLFLAILVFGYFVFMLPSLYVDYVSDKNYQSVVAQHTQYLKDGNYENVKVSNPSCISIEISFTDDVITITGKTFQSQITPTTEEMQSLIGEIKEYLKTYSNSMTEENFDGDVDRILSDLKTKAEEWKEEFKQQMTFVDEIPFQMVNTADASYYESYWDESYWNESTKIHFYSDDTMFVEAGIQDGENQYTNYIGLTYDKNHIVLSIMPSMTPQMNEITPIVIHSLPMLLAVIILFALVVSALYSRGIVEPIRLLVRNTERLEQNGITQQSPIPSKGKDEIAILTRTLNELYSKLHDNYVDLEMKNDSLKQKNRSQEVFLRSSSHQLKTPISAALLLVESMINEVGKYKDTKTYLPEVKQQLLSMKKIVEEVLYLNKCEDNIFLEKVELSELIDEKVREYEIQANEIGQHFMRQYNNKSEVMTDRNLFLQVLDNLISNAIHHSEEHAEIRITLNKNEIILFNAPAHINEAIEKDIFEPFVHGNKKGHGLGLYIVGYYAKLLGVNVEIGNVENGVETRLRFEEQVI